MPEHRKRVGQLEGPQLCKSRSMGKKKIPRQEDGGENG